jgi:hypothetical protein
MMVLLMLLSILHTEVDRCLIMYLRYCTSEPNARVSIPHGSIVRRVPAREITGGLERSDHVSQGRHRQRQLAEDRSRASFKSAKEDKKNKGEVGDYVPVEVPY